MEASESQLRTAGSDPGTSGESGSPSGPEALEDRLRSLPPYARSLLKIDVPVTVILAESKQRLQSILNIGPGTIIHFNKSCEETLTLEVSGRKFAVGETVKVGDKFGLWITSIVLPEERFWAINRRQRPERVK